MKLEGFREEEGPAHGMNSLSVTNRIADIKTNGLDAAISRISCIAISE